MTSRRIEQTENPYIEDILDRYSHLPNLTNLALGSSYWSPPESCLNGILADISTRDTQRYGNILGYPPLIQKLRDLLTAQGLDLSDENIAITSGANQGFMNVALTLTDAADDVVVLSPYYFSHLLSLQLCQSKVHICSFNNKTLEPNWIELEDLIRQHHPKLIVLTSPNNPSGFVWEEHHIRRLKDICALHSPSTWLVIDQTYYELHYSFDSSNPSERPKHFFPNRKVLEYDQIIQLFSLSKVFGMPGWRVGFIVFPQQLTNAMRKIQDTIPTHAAMISQKLALRCLDTYSLPNDATAPTVRNDWFQHHLAGLDRVREALWPILRPLGTVKTYGAFYFLVPLPPLVTEEEVVDIFATKYGILLMPGSPFGAKNHLRLSYGSIPPDTIVQAIEQLKNGFDEILHLSQQRSSTSSS